MVGCGFAASEGATSIMERRTWLGVVAALLSSASVAEAQPARRARIGFLGNGDPVTGAAQLDALRNGLHESNWIEGRTLDIEYRWAEGRLDRIPALVADLV